MRILALAAPARAAEPAVEVRGERGYAQEDQVTGTRMRRPVRDVAQTVTVVGERVLKDTVSRRVDDALPLVPGVQLGSGFGSLWDDYYVRGSRLWSGTMARNGFLAGYSGLAATDSIDVERIEVLRGPTAVLYGPGQPGGAINIVTKRPQREAKAEVGAGVGSFAARRLWVDATGPLSGQVAYRVVGAADGTDGVRDFNDSSRVIVNPSATWQASKRTTWFIESRLHRVRYRPDPAGVPALGGDPLALPASRTIIEPTTPLTSFDGALLRAEVVHAVTESFRVRVGVQRQTALEDESAVYPLGLEADGRTMDRIPTHLRLAASDIAAQATAELRASTGSVGHDVIFGVDLRHETVGWRLGTADPSVNPFPIDVITPRYGSPAPAVLEPPGPDNRWRYSDAGVHASDTLKLLPSLRLVAGARADVYRQTSTAPGVDDKKGEVAPSGRVGVLFDPHEVVSFYGNVATSFWPVLGVSADAHLLAPERSLGVDAGTRLTLARGVMVNAAVFDLRSRNISVPDPARPEFQVQRGASESRGAELFATVEPVRALRALASYTLTDATITRDTRPELVGRSLPYVARHSGALWAFATLPVAGSAQAEVGAGGIATGARHLSDGTEIPGYARMDAVLGFRLGRTRVAGRIENVTNARYVRSGDGTMSLQLGAGRNAFVTASVEL